MASAFYNNFFEELAKAFYNESTPSGTVKIALMTTSYTFSKTDAHYSDLTGEASGNNYTAGGQAVDNLSITQNDTDDRADIDFDDEVFGNITVSSVDAYVLYKDTGTPSTSPLIAYIEFTEGEQSIAGGDFTVSPPAAGAHTVG